MKLLFALTCLVLLAGCASTPSPKTQVSDGILAADPVTDCASTPVSPEPVTVRSTAALPLGESSHTSMGDIHDVLVFRILKDSYINMTIESDGARVGGRFQWSPGLYETGNGFEKDLRKYEHYIPAGCHTVLIGSGSHGFPYTVTLNAKNLDELTPGAIGPFTVRQAWTDLGVIHVAQAGHLNVTTSKTGIIDAGLYLERMPKDRWYQSATTIGTDVEAGTYVLRYSVGSIDYHKFPTTFTATISLT